MRFALVRVEADLRDLAAIAVGRLIVTPSGMG